ncbi:MAG: polyprenyl diphosphate synthase [Gemmatimonadota bacterium]
MSSPLLEQIRLNGAVPRHVAVIMDGNGRWARQRGKPRYEGHRAGMRGVREAIEGATLAGVEILTLFAFSHENWQRPRREIAALMGLLEQYARKEGAELAKQGVAVHVIGDVEALPDTAQAAVRDLEANTRTGSRLTLVLALNYGSRGELARAARRIVERVCRGELDPAAIDESVLQGELFTAAWPDPDLLIRTSGEHRLSNFLLWQMAYTELFVTPVLWPDFTREDLFAAIVDYQRRERRFGKVPV